MPMGLIFDKNTAQIYATWRRSSHGRAIDRSIEHFIPALLDPKPGQRVIDIGCGSGNHLLILNKMGLNVNGIDASPYMIQKAEARLGQSCTLKVGMAESLPYEDNEFDLAVLINSLEFFENPLQALREAGRVANSKVFIGVLNSLSWNGLLRRVQGHLGHPLFNRTRLFNFWQITSLLKKAYGPAPISWECIRIRRPSADGSFPFEPNTRFIKRSPFRFFLGFSVKMTYRFKTDNIPLKIKLKKAGNSLVGVRTLEDLRRSKRE